MPTPEEKQVDAQLNMLLAIQFQGLDPVKQLELKKALDGVREDYKIAIAKGKTEKYYKDLADSIVKNLPLLVKGTQSAITAFEKGDYISGTAALFDIAASIVPMLTNLASAAGPEGLLLGALLSLVGQILGFFAPKQPSLESKIQKMLDQLQSDTQIATITAIGHSINSYTSTLRAKSTGVRKWEAPVALAGTVSLTSDSPIVAGAGTNFTLIDAVGQWLTFDADISGTPYKVAKIEDDGHLTLATPYRGGPVAVSALKLSRTTTEQKSIAQILEMPLTSQAEADAFLVEMKVLKYALGWNHAKLDAPVFANWEAAGYLELESNQSKEGWPEVLGLWCEIYINLLTANTMLTCLADPKALEARIAETREPEQAPEPHEKGRLPEASRRDCHTALLNLQAMLTALYRAWDSDRTEMLKIVGKLTPVARERGLYAHLGFKNGTHVLHVAPGTGKATLLSWGDYKVDNLDGISIHVPSSQKDSLTPKYLLLTCRGEIVNRTDRHIVDSVTGNLSEALPVITGRNPIDPTSMFALTPGLGQTDTLVDVSAFAFAEGTPGVEPDAHPATLVSVVFKNGNAHYLNYYALDRDYRSTLIKAGPRLDVTRAVRSLYLPATPLLDDPDADGLLCEPRPAANSVLTYVAFADGIDLCVLEWLDGAFVKGPEDWLNYVGVEVDANHVWLYGWSGIACATHASVIKCKRGLIERPTWLKVEIDKKVGDGLNVRAIYPCADGTLFVCMHDDIYTAEYRIDRQNGRVVSSSWTVRGGVAKQLIKMPIPCWSMLESLSASLLAD
jgi:hypothetical protein